MKRSKLSRVDQADYFDNKISDMLKVISASDETPEENTAHYSNISLIFLREIMINTAIIADYCANHSIPDYPNNKERSRASDSFKETDA